MCVCVCVCVHALFIAWPLPHSLALSLPLSACLCICAPQDKLTSLHGLYQRLLVGRVLLPQPDPQLPSFSWAELNAALQEQAAALTSDLSRANEKVGRPRGSPATWEGVGGHVNNSLALIMARLQLSLMLLLWAC